MLSEKSYTEMRKSVVLISMLLFASLSAVSVVGELSWSSVGLTSTENSYNSIAIDGNKNVHVAYYSDDNHALEYAFYDGSSWTYTTVDSGGTTSDHVGKYNSIAVDSTDSPHISYYDETNGNLKYAFFDGVVWTLDTIDDSIGDVGMYSSIALDSSDGAYVSYYNATGENPALLMPPGSSILGWEWPSSDNTGLYTSIAIDSQDDLHLTYYDATNGDLEYKYSDDPFTTSWGHITIDSSGDVGMYSSLAVDSDDTPHVSYFDGTNENLKYSFDELGAGGGSWATPTVVDSGGTVGLHTSIAINPNSENNEVHISHYDDSNGALKYTAGSNGNFATTSFVDGGAGIDVGTHSSIAIDSNGKLHIIYVAITSSGDILKYASAEPEIGGGITGHLEWDEENTVMTGQASLSDLDPGEEYSVAWELINDDTGGVISTFPNTSVTAPTSGVWSSSSHSWDLNTLNRGVKYCVEADLYADEPGENGDFLDSHTVCTTIPNLSNEEIFSELEWQESTSRLSGYIQAVNLTSNSDYVANWRLVYNSNNSQISTFPNSTITGDVTGVYTSNNNTWSLSLSEITRGLVYCIDSELYADTGESLDDSYSCKQIPTSGGGNDDDSDGVLNTIDICPNTSPFETVDSDGCSQSQLDDDVDGVANSADSCPNGQSGWTSSSSTDYDGDGCKDDGEDDDDDNDSIDDDDDGCPTGHTNWNSWDENPVIDYDHDGCKDSIEDDDADDDGVDDAVDSCTFSNIGAQVDASGCQTNFFDDDGDGVANSYDNCPDTDAGTAVDFWGCEEGRSSETEDRDGDGIYNAHDNCWDGETGWTSDELTTDYDTDGCRDATEDWDDDDDGIDDSIDNCYNGQRNWYSWDNDPEIDYDHDGCLDSNEDNDDDADGVDDANGDNCLLTRLGAVVDTNGCETSFPDDDNDGVSNSYDQCPNTPQNTPAEEIDDWNGCAYNDQSGGIFGQLFPQGAINYVSSSCNGPDDLSAQCMQAWEGWCSENSFNHPACEVIVNECEEEADLLGPGIHRDFYFDEPDNDFSTNNNDILAEIETGADNEEINWAFLRVKIDVGGGWANCEVGAASNQCKIAGETGSDNSVWEVEENIELQENGLNVCSDTNCHPTVLIEDSRLDNETIAWAKFQGDGEILTIDDLPDDWLPEMCVYLDIVEDDDDEDDETEGSGDTEDNETDDSTGDEWWAEIPVAGEIIAQIQSKYGKIIGATVFTLGVIGYGYRAITFRSEMVMNKRVKKFKKRIKRASRASTLRQIQTDVEKAEEKRLLPTGAYGDLLSMIEMRAEDIGLTDFIPKETLAAAGISDDEFREGMDALNEARDELFMATDELRRQGQQRAQRIPVERGGRQKDLVSLKAQSKSSISRPSYHPKDINKDGNVDEEDERMWAAMSDEERQARSSGPFGGDTNLTSQILAFSKVPASSKSPCHCGSRKQYRKCHMRKDRCPCGSKKKFLSCCAKKRRFK